MIEFITTPYALEDIQKLKESGSTAVVIGTPFFSVRSVCQFPVDALATLKKECEKHDVKMYVLVNRFFVEEEIEPLRAHLRLLKELDVDGIYFGDECVLYEAEVLGMKDKLIYNPDTLITNHGDVQYYLDEGIKMVTISKEITLSEICTIAQKTTGNCEVLIHGRLNMLHSKRNLLTNYMSFLEREDKVHDNMHLYIMEEKREEKMPILEDETGTHIFSGFTLASFEELQDMVNAGIRHFRIDGIFHDIAYVLEALTLYKEVLEGKRKGHETFVEYQKQYASDHVTHGFYYTKTSKVKEG